MRITQLMFRPVLLLLALAALQLGHGPLHQVSYAQDHGKQYVSQEELNELFKLCPPEKFKDETPLWPVDLSNEAFPEELYAPRPFEFRQAPIPAEAKVRPYPAKLADLEASGLSEAAFQKKRKKWDEKEERRIRKALQKHEKDEKKRYKSEKEAWDKAEEARFVKAKQDWETYMAGELNEKINQKKSDNANLKYWFPTLANGFTSPYDYDPRENYQYIVHGICENNLGNKLMYDLKKIERLHLSVSLITRQRNSTYAHHGVILRVHPDLIYATSCSNMGRCGASVQSMNPKFGIKTPQDILRDTKLSSKRHAQTMEHNELSVLGSHGDKKVEIVGLFARRALSTTNSHFTNMTKKRLEYLKKLCQEKKWPVIPID